MLRIAERNPTSPHGIPQDITLQELRIESFFPMDDEKGRIFRTWAARAD